jgi:hypothetical protein
MEPSLLTTLLWIPVSLALHLNIHEGSHVGVMAMHGCTPSEYRPYPSISNGHFALADTHVTYYPGDACDRALHNPFTYVAPLAPEGVWMLGVSLLNGSLTDENDPKGMWRAIMRVEFVMALLDIGGFLLETWLPGDHDAQRFRQTSGMDVFTSRFIATTAAVALVIPVIKFKW